MAAGECYPAGWVAGHGSVGDLPSPRAPAGRPVGARRSPFTGLLRGLPRAPADEMVCLTTQEFLLVRETFVPHYQPFVTFLNATGLRLGEITALGPEHFDLCTAPSGSPGRDLGARVFRRWSSPTPLVTGSRTAPSTAGTGTRRLFLTPGGGTRAARLKGGYHTRLRGPGGTFASRGRQGVVLAWHEGRSHAYGRT
jgi:hypothetical protein